MLYKLLKLLSIDESPATQLIYGTGGILFTSSRYPQLYLLLIICGLNGFNGRSKA